MVLKVKLENNRLKPKAYRADAPDAPSAEALDDDENKIHQRKLLLLEAKK